MPGRQRRDGGSNGPAADNKTTTDNAQGRGGDRGRGRGRDERRGRGVGRWACLARGGPSNPGSQGGTGGRRFSFTALVILGDGNGMVGVGYGKAKEVPAAIQKGSEEARKNFFRVPLIASTIPHPIQGEAAAGVVMLRPASPGTGVIAGGAARAVLECAGVNDILCKSLGSDNAINVVHATVAALKGLHRPEEVAARRGLPIEDVAPAGMLRARAGQGA
ncbi:30S ribosomal protein S5 [Dietzia maris]|uniref:30S ribosomal protein S5 n=1 Tax=Dietzia maris TaxID=37915 RepID=UPI00341B24D6